MADCTRDRRDRSVIAPKAGSSQDQPDQRADGLRPKAGSSRDQPVHWADELAPRAGSSLGQLDVEVELVVPLRA